MNKKYIFFILPVALIVSCSPIKRGSRSNEVIVAELKQERILLYPETSADSRYRDLLKSGIAAPEGSVVKVRRFNPEVIFTSAQRVSVKYSDNTLPKSGMVLDLDKLSEEFTSPCNGEILSEYGIRGSGIHTGIDVRATSKDTIRTIFDGVVRHARRSSSYGNVIVVRHYNGLETVYSHNTRNLVKENDVLVSGDAIALAGRTGRATTVHLHFEVRVDGEYFNPRKLIDFKEHTLQSGTLTVTRDNRGKVQAVLSSLDVKENMPSDRPSFGDSSPTPDPSKKYHKIKSGDTLYGIALRYKTTTAKLCKLNNITKNTTIKIGKTLRIK